MSLARNLSKFKPSSSGLVETADIADDAVSTDQIANNAVINTSGAITTTGAFTSTGIDDNADATAITINSSEQVGIGTTSPSTLLHVNSASGNSAVTFQTANNGSSVSSNYTTPNRTYYTGIDIGGVNSAYTIYDGSASAERFKLDSSGNVTVNSGNLVIGTSGKGIDFSASSNVSGMSSELLDDYEEGSAFINIEDEYGNEMSAYEQDGQYNICRYTKIGRMVYFTIRFYCNSSSGYTGSNAARITDLPFTSASGMAVGGCWVTNGYTHDLATSSALISGGSVSENTQTIFLYKQDTDGTFSQLTLNELNCPRLDFAGFYIAS